MTAGTTRGTEHRTPAQVRVGAIHAYDLRGLTAAESAEALLRKQLKDALAMLVKVREAVRNG